GAAEAAEDLSSDRVIPVPERGANRPRSRRPRPASQNLVVGAKEFFRVFFVRETLKSWIAVEVTRRPLPHVTDHPAASNGRNVPLVGADRRRVKGELIDIGDVSGNRRVAPRVIAGASRRRIPCSCRLPLKFSRQPFTGPFCKGFCFMKADMADRTRGIDLCFQIHGPVLPAISIAAPVLGRVDSAL